MKKNILFLLTITVLTIFYSNEAYAQTKAKITPSPTPKDLKEEGIEQIQKIKDIVASKVAELNLVEKRGFIGVVTDTSTSQITIKDKSDLQRIVDIDDLTKFEGSDDETFGISDVKNGNTLIFLGLYNKDNKHLLARQIKKPGNIPTSLSGIVSKIDEDNFQIEVTTEENKKMKVDIEKSTKTSSYSKGGEIEKSGFSKIKLHERILIVGFPDPENKETINASRIMHFIDLPASVKMRIHAGVKEEQSKTE